MLANVRDAFNRSAHITDLVGWNLYLGWYVPGFFLNDLFLRFFPPCIPEPPDRLFRVWRGRYAKPSQQKTETWRPY